MPSYLRTFGSHYEAWRLDDGHLLVRVTHVNQQILRAQRGLSPVGWWNRYCRKSLNDHTRAVRHAGDLVRAYPEEFQGGRVRFQFEPRGQRGVQPQPFPSTTARDQTAPSRESPARSEGGKPAHGSPAPEDDSRQITKPIGGDHHLDEQAFQHWLRGHFASSELQAIPLFETSNLVALEHRDRIPLRHPKMERFYRDLIVDVRGSAAFCGIIYCMYWLQGGQIVPLYVGKTERYGTNGAISANLATGTGSFFGRWGYSRYYHLGDLGAGLRGESTYQDWVDKLFKNPADLRLRAQVFFGAATWKHSDLCSCGQPVHVVGLEACMIRHAWKYFPQDNLNKRIDDRDCRCP